MPSNPFSNKEAKRSNRIAEQQLAEQQRFNNEQIANMQEQLAVQQEGMDAQRAAFEQQTHFYAGQLSLLSEQNAAQKNQFEIANARAEKQAKENEEALNRTLAKKPNPKTLLAGARQAAKGGVSSTLLTGKSGVQTNDLSLGGGSSLLGS